MNAVERGMELLTTKIGKLPPLALEHCKYMCKRFMMCSEVCLTAYTNYAQIVEGHETDDELYKLNPNDKTHKEIIEWFKENNNEKT